MMPRRTKGIVDDANGHRPFPNFKMASLGKEVAPHDVQQRLPRTQCTHFLPVGAASELQLCKRGSRMLTCFVGLGGHQVQAQSEG